MDDKFSIRKLDPADGPACCSVNCCTARDLDPMATSPDKYVRDIYEVRMDATAKLLCRECLEDVVRTIDGFMENERVKIKKERRPSMKIKGIEIEKNPERLKPGDTCWGVYIPAFLSRTMYGAVTGSTDIIHGTLQASYGQKRVDGIGNDMPAHFLPDQLLPGTSYAEAIYDIRNWFVSASKNKAITARASFAKNAIESRQEEIRQMEKFL